MDPHVELADQMRSELRAWLDQHVTDEVRALPARQGTERGWADLRTWNATLADAGWGAVSWPVEHGGRAAGVLEQVAYHEEMSRSGAPGPVNAIGLANIAPAILAVGTPDQQRRFLRPMLRGDDIWSQGMSEPDAGSDLASLRCRAVRDGDHWVVDGCKTWNSNGHRADWCQLFVRTDPDAPPHAGITCLLLDMTAKGVDARPITTMAGDASFAEVHLDGVRVHADAVLGEVGGGWAVATRTLSNERAGVAPLHLGLRRKLDRLLAEAAATGAGGEPLARAELSTRYVEARAFELLARRTLEAASAGRPPGPEGSVVKLAWSEAEQALARSAVDLLGPAALDGHWATGLLSSRSLTIAGGTSEVNRNIVGERVLGLPKEPVRGSHPSPSST